MALPGISHYQGLSMAGTGRILGWIYVQIWLLLKWKWTSTPVCDAPPIWGLITCLVAIDFDG
jgi:hypothetical protein